MLRTRRAGRRNRLNGENPPGDMTIDLPIPAQFRCPISLDLMKDPVTLSTGITYDRQNIDAWLKAGNRTCPVTNQELTTHEQIPNHTIRRMIQEWCVANCALGVERIPTPRIPVTPAEVSEILSKIMNASQCGDLDGCRELVKKIKEFGMESELDRQCIVASEAGRVMAALFDSFATASAENYGECLEEILSMLTWMLPLDDNARSRLRSHSSLRCMVWFLERGSLAGRRSAALVMVKDLASSDQELLSALSETEGLIEALVKMIKEPICPTATKASLLAIFYLISPLPASSLSTPSASPTLKEKAATTIVDMGLVPVLLEMLVDSDRSITEKALGVLDALCGFEEGREKAYNQALTMPVLVKKILRVSELATEFAISIIWKLCKNYREEGGRTSVEALQVGAFQKVLLVLQLGCSERTKEKATNLLKLLNPFRSRGECIDSMDFKQLKRSF